MIMARQLSRPLASSMLPITWARKGRPSAGRQVLMERHTKSSSIGRILDVPPYGVRRKSEAATALLLIRSRPLTSKRRRAHLPPHSICSAMDALGGTCKMRPAPSKVNFFPCKVVPTSPYLLQYLLKGMHKAVVCGLAIGRAKSRLAVGLANSGIQPILSIRTTPNPLGNAQPMHRRKHCLADSTYEEQLQRQTPDSFAQKRGFYTY